MLLIISDLHLTDGTTGDTIDAHAFRVFRARLGDMAYDASWRSSDVYQPIEQLDIVLLGDVLDLIRSTEWTDSGPLRPWHDPADPDYANLVSTITNRVISANAASLKVLRSLSQGNRITVPPATSQGKPARVSHNPSSPERLPVKVNIHYMVGNHDWFYHLPGEAYDRIRSKIIHDMGLANSPGPFPHDLAESEGLRGVFERHQVYGRHGDIYDPFNYDVLAGRDRATLGDALVVNLFNLFPSRVKQELGGVESIPDRLFRDLNELGSVVPSILAPVWIDSTLRRYYGVEEVHRKRINDIWDELADELLDLEFVRQQDKAFQFDAVDALQAVLKLSRGFSFQKISELILRFRHAVKGDDSFSFAKHALKEAAFLQREAKFFVYGHTHGHEVVPLHSSIKDKRYFEQVYFNSGTWHPLYSMTRLHPKQKNFISSNTMTYLAFYQGDERSGLPYDAWSGAIGRR